ncbi:MAG: VOC family protein [Ilumatobacter sp.]
MAVIDHLVIAVPDLDRGIDWFEQSVGIRPAFGGAHDGMGTHNALASLGDSYVELIAPDPNQPEPSGPRPFGVNRDSDPALVTFAARPSDGETIEYLANVMRSNGHEPGPLAEMSRTTSDGTTLRWRLTFPTGERDGFVPFLIDWGDTPHPASTAPDGARLIELRGATTQHLEVNAVLDAIGIGGFASGGSTGLAAALAGPGERIWSI